MMAAQRSSAPGQSEAFLTSMARNMPAVVFAKFGYLRFILLNRASEIPRHSVRCHYRQDRPRFLSQGADPLHRPRPPRPPVTPSLLIGTGSATKSFRLELRTFLGAKWRGQLFWGLRTVAPARR